MQDCLTIRRQVKLLPWSLFVYFITPRRVVYILICTRLGISWVILSLISSRGALRRPRTPLVQSILSWRRSKGSSLKMFGLAWTFEANGLLFRLLYNISQGGHRFHLRSMAVCTMPKTLISRPRIAPFILTRMGLKLRIQNLPSDHLVDGTGWTTEGRL